MRTALALTHARRTGAEYRPLLDHLATEEQESTRSQKRRAKRRSIFPFLDLPAELRNKIYAELLTLTKENDSIQRHCWPQILAASKQINNEARRMLYAGNVIDINILSQFCTTGKNPQIWYSTAKPLSFLPQRTTTVGKVIAPSLLGQKHPIIDCPDALSQHTGLVIRNFVRRASATPPHHCHTFRHHKGATELRTVMEQSGPQIPHRTSSKKVRPRPETEDSEPDLLEREEQLKRAQRESTKRLKESRSCSSEYWNERGNYEKLWAKRDQLTLESSFESLRSTDESWTWSNFIQTDGARENLEQQNTRHSQAQVYFEQAKSIDDGPGNIALQHAFMQLFITSSQGLDCSSGINPRKKTEQQALRMACVETYGAAHPDSRREEYWCPIMGEYIYKAAIKAAHICPARFAGDLAETIFGSSAGKEIMTVRNCMIMAACIEERFDEFTVALVPDVDDTSDAQMMEAWYHAEPKSYRVQIFDRGNKSLCALVPGRNITYKELDGQKVQWKTDARPRTRFLWLHYCCCVIVKARGYEGPWTIEKEFGEKYWGTIGPWFKDTMLIAAIKHLGHDYDRLFLPNGSEIEASGQPDFSLVAAINSNIQSRHDAEEDDESEDDEPEEDGDEGDPLASQ